MGDHCTLMCRLTSSVWSTELSEFADLGGIFTVLGFCTNHKYERDRTLGDRDRMDIDYFRGGNGPSQLRQLVYLQSCFENVHTRRNRDTV